MASNPDTTSKATCKMHTLYHIPNDIRLELFKLCIFDTKSFLHVSHVCRSWRALVHDSPGFWTDITLYIRGHRPVGKAKYWLKRAGTLPLSVSILRGITERSARSEERNMEDIATTLQVALHRFHTLRPSGPILLDTADIFFGILSGPAPLLQVLDIRVKNPDRLNVVEDRLNVAFSRGGESIPNVRATFIGCYSNFPPSFARAITYLYLDINVGAEEDNIARLLDSCTNLSHLELMSDLPSDIGTPMTDLIDKVTLPHLTTLRIEKINDPYYILELLDIPSLQHLWLDMFTWYPDMITNITEIIESCPSLSSIYLNGDHCDLDWSDDEDALSFDSTTTIALPLVESFGVLGNPSNAHGLLQRLVLPHVRKLEFERVSSDVVRRYIASTTDLTYLKLVAIMIKAHPFSSTPISLPALTRLEVVSSVEILNYLNTPSLTHLEIDGGHRSSSSNPRLREMLQRCNPPLVSLGLSNIRKLSEGDLMAVLPQLSQLSHLKLVRCPLSNIFLRALYKSESADPPTPRLETNLPVLSEIQFIELDPIIETPRH